MRLPRATAWSSARIELCRPITNGIMVCGNTTTSRIGTMGRVSITSFSRPNMASLRRSGAGGTPALAALSKVARGTRF